MYRAKLIFWFGLEKRMRLNGLSTFDLTDDIEYRLSPIHHGGSGIKVWQHQRSAASGYVEVVGEV